jgi:hypothetical protein
LVDTYNAEIRIINDECWQLNGKYNGMASEDLLRMINIDIDKIAVYLRTKNRDDLFHTLVDLENKSINDLLIRIIKRWLRYESEFENDYLGISYYFNSPAYGNIIKLFYVNGG